MAIRIAASSVQRPLSTPVVGIRAEVVGVTTAGGVVTGVVSGGAVTDVVGEVMSEAVVVDVGAGLTAGR